MQNVAFKFETSMSLSAVGMIRKTWNVLNRQEEEKTKSQFMLRIVISHVIFCAALIHSQDENLLCSEWHDAPTGTWKNQIKNTRESKRKKKMLRV